MGLRDGRIVFGASNNNPVLLDPSVPSVRQISTTGIRNIREDANGDILFMSVDGKSISRWKRSSEEAEVLWNDRSGDTSSGQLLSLPDGSRISGREGKGD